MIPREIVVDPDGTIPRLNPCGGRFWNGYARVSCEAEAPEGFARCALCAAAEKAAADRKREDAERRAAEAPPKRRRKS